MSAWSDNYQKAFRMISTACEFGRLHIYKKAHRFQSCRVAELEKMVLYLHRKKNFTPCPYLSANHLIVLKVQIKRYHVFRCLTEMSEVFDYPVSIFHSLVQ